MINQASVNALRQALPALTARDREFAQSLCDQGSRKFLSEKQLYWVGELLRRANGETSDKPTTNVGNVSGIVALLDTAQKHLKHPAIMVRANGRDIRLSIAGNKAKVPGAINVCSAAGGFDTRDWYGRITRDGEFEPSRKYDQTTQTAVAMALQALAADPAKAAADYGHLTGVCCFCNHPLTDERSTEVGYGPVCARHYGLPWGSVATSQQLSLLAA